MYKQLYHETERQAGMSRKHLYKNLRAEMANRSLTQEDIPEILDRSQSYVDRRFSGKHAWSLDDAYKLMETLQQPVADLPLLFPKGGLS